MEYGYGRELEATVEEVLERTRASLQREGFGILFEINLDEKMKEKLGVDFRRYVVLGACNPGIAYESLQEEIALGLLLPCNVIVYEGDGPGRPVVAAIDAEKMMKVTGNEKLSGAADRVNGMLKRVIAGV
ncbi:MAG: DUF302 domain-containing protein [Acidobacteria bacterium]|nr:DUF302 domain-containing protein [Acidobacteriota bacterium]